ncbi:helix-turn-helix domain-containing protein [Agrobacterium vitis]|uniref:helix-turn-helix domain-containing protein n=1 Tax=Agrobacterium vitis TaxID=373 RepID=UPI001F370258|nr:helix-turn-helix domain-containing protein [Agrobacterium vitis]
MRNAKYTTVPNHVFEDTRLSIDARWLLGYLLSKPDNWVVVIGDICNKAKCGRDKARKMIAELVEIGYAEREQVRDDGKFGATVLLIFDEPRQAVSDGSDAAPESVAFLPQTEMPSPVKPSPVLPSPVKPSPVLPSPVKSAHSNNLQIVNTDSQQGEGVCESELEGDAVPAAEEKAGKREDRARIGRQFDAWYKIWPKRGSHEFARNAWFALSADEREACIERTPAYIDWAKSDDLTAPAVYLKARAWTDLPENPATGQEPARVVAKVCGKLWMGRRLEALFSEPTGRFVITTFDERRISSGAISREALVREKRRDHGWPLVSQMHDLVRRVEPFFTAVDLLPLVAEFQAVQSTSELFAAWKRLHERRGWMFVEGLRDWNYFPPVDPDQPDLDAAVEAALDDFQTSLSEGRTHDAA